MILIDIENKIFMLEVLEEEIKRRFEILLLFELKVKKGYFYRYLKFVRFVLIGVIFE